MHLSSGPILESKGMHTIFQKKGKKIFKKGKKGENIWKKRAKKGKIFEKLGKNVQNLTIF